MLGKSRVAVIIVNWNNRKATSHCLDSVGRLNSNQPDIFIVDNGSEDDSVSYLSRRYPHVELMQLSANEGFSCGANAGIRRAMAHDYDFLWLLNNDAEPTGTALSSLLKCMEKDERIGMTGSVLVEEVNGRSTEMNGGRVSFVTGLPSNERLESRPDRLEYIKGASVLLRTRALIEVGCFDERFFLYWEDADLCYRLRTKGWKLCIAEESRVFHQGHGSMKNDSSGWDYHFTRSSLLFYFKHAPFPLLPAVVSVSGRLVKRLVYRRWENAAAVVKAVFAGHRGLSANTSIR